MNRFFLFVASLLVCAAAQAQPYPGKAIKIICPFPPGGIADTFSRVIGQKLADTWGQPVVVDNRTGAGGNIGSEAAAKSAPDGYTLLVSNIGTHAVNQFLFKSMPFDAVKDFVPVAHVLDAEGLLVVHPDVKATTVAELVALAKANPGKLTYASGGIGTTSHLAGEMFKSMAKVDLIHVPYKGNAPAISDLLGGQTQMIFATMPTVIQHVRAGKLRAIAVVGGTRSSLLPDVPTIGETLAGFDVSNWIGMFAPAGTPMEIVVKLNAEIQKIMRMPDVVTRMQTEGARFIPTTPESFAAFQKAEIAKWGKAIQDAGIKAE